MRSYTRELIIAGILERDNEVIRWLYLRVYTYLEIFISRRNGTPVDAMDIFHEGLLVLFEKIRDARLPDKRNVPEYLFGICRYLWYKYYRESRRFTGRPASDLDRVRSLAEGDFPVLPDRRELRYILYLRHLSLLDMKCRRLLEMYLDRRDTEEIRQALSYLNRNSVYRKKYGCLRKLVQRILHDPDYAYL